MEATISNRIVLKETCIICLQNRKKVIEQQSPPHMAGITEGMLKFAFLRFDL